jgi:hypothetical protein
MKNTYEIYCKSAQERLALLQTLTKIGCKIHGKDDYTPESFNKKFPYSTSSTIEVVVKDKYVQGLGQNHRGGPGIEQLGEVVTALLAKKPEVVFPTPMKYRVVYTTLEGETKEYTVSNPISSENGKITVYAYGHGIRSLIVDRISEFTKLEDCPF